MMFAIVFATPILKMNSAMKFASAAHSTATRGERTRVDTIVAIEFAASWKPLMTSKISATTMVTMTMPSITAPVSLRFAPLACRLVAQACSRMTPSMMFATSSQRSEAFSRFS